MPFLSHTPEYIIFRATFVDDCHYVPFLCLNGTACKSSEGRGKILRTPREVPFLAQSGCCTLRQRVLPGLLATPKASAYTKRDGLANAVKKTDNARQLSLPWPMAITPPRLQHSPLPVRLSVCARFVHDFPPRYTLSVPSVSRWRSRIRLD